MHGRGRHGDPRKKMHRRTDLTTAVIVTVVTRSLAKRLVAAAREPRHAVGSDAGHHVE